MAEADRGKLGYPEVFTVPPPDYAPKKPGQLSEAEVEEFFDKVKICDIIRYGLHTIDSLKILTDTLSKKNNSNV